MKTIKAIPLMGQSFTEADVETLKMLRDTMEVEAKKVAQLLVDAGIGTWKQDKKKGDPMMDRIFLNQKTGEMVLSAENEFMREDGDWFQVGSLNTQKVVAVAGPLLPRVIDGRIKIF